MEKIYRNEQGKRHRLDGPGPIGDYYRDGYINPENGNGYLHRENGPAMNYSEGSKAWWIHDYIIGRFLIDNNQKIYG